MDENHSMREHVLYLLGGGGAHVGFERAVADLPIELRGKRARGLPHTPWRLVEHMRIAQWDILEFCRHARHVSPEFPKGYWPSEDSPPSDSAWDESLDRFRSDLNAMQELVRDEAIELLAPIPHGDGQTLLREALLVADHNAYHLGQLITLRRLIGGWPAD